MLTTTGLRNFTDDGFYASVVFSQSPMRSSAVFFLGFRLQSTSS